ncbi:hypothetical protein [Spirochaeta dissipatitropha]
MTVPSKRFLTAFVLFNSCLLLFTANIWSQTMITGVELLYSPELIDTRIIGGMRSRSANAPASGVDMRELQVGSIFLTEDNIARRVTDIYTHNGRTIIETVEPRPEDVLLGVFVPDFDLVLDETNLLPLPRGVNYLRDNDNYPSHANLLSEQENPALSKLGSTLWIETDEQVKDLELLSLRIDIPLWQSSVPQESRDQIDGMIDAGNTKGTNTDNNETDSESGGKPSLEVGKSGEIRLTGVLRFTKPRVSGGLKKPSMKVSWITNWWHPPIPRFSFTKGYGRAEVTAAQQFDFLLSGTMELSAEVSVPIAMFMVADPTGTVRFVVSLTARINLDGTITLGAEVSEYTYLRIGVQGDLIWPMIPTRASGNADFYMNAAFRPFVAADAELRAGLYLGGDFNIAGISVASLEGGGGLYIMATGYMEPLGVMGFDTRRGGYGNFNEWILYVAAEAGAFANVDASILFWNKNLYFRRWPFWEFVNQWEF